MQAYSATPVSNKVYDGDFLIYQLYVNGLLTRGMSLAEFWPGPEADTGASDRSTKVESHQSKLGDLLDAIGARRSVPPGIPWSVGTRT